MKKIRQFAVKTAFTSVAFASVSLVFTVAVVNVTMHNKKLMNRCADPIKMQLSIVSVEVFVFVENASVTQEATLR